MHRLVVCVGVWFVIVTGHVVDSSTVNAESSRRPNIVLILADDLGYSDLGCYGGEIQTPNLDGLAAGGLRYTQFYNTGRCWPTRASILTGYYPQSVRRDKVPGIKSGGAGVRPDWAPLMCELLGDADYRTYHTGKWHIDGMPIDSGFDLSYYLKDQNRFFNPTVHFKNDQKLRSVSKDSGFYATIALGDHAVECLEEHAERHSGQPFFHYLAFTAPHFPLHALPEDIDKYRNTYRAGWDRIRGDRWEKIQEIGLVSAKLSDVQRDVGPPYHRPDDLRQLGDQEINRPVRWDSLTARQREFQATKMAIHAAMIDCMDQQVGRVIAQLRRMKQFDNTLIIFLSDNGASAEIMVRGDGHDPNAPMGSWTTHLCLGPGWSTVSNTPFRYHKTWTHEGGTATPLIVHWTDGMEARGQLRRQAGHVIDFWPTLMEVTGVTESDSDQPRKPGVSLVPSFSTNTDDPRTLWWSHEGNRALRKGNWKISAVENGAWELYRVDHDRTETFDLARSHLEKLKELSNEWDELNDRHCGRALKQTAGESRTKRGR